MRTIHLTILTVIFFSLLSCSKDEETAIALSSSDIVGVWALKDVRCSDGVYVTESGGEKFISTFKYTGKDYAANVTIGENPNSYLSEGSYNGIAVVTFDGQTETVEIPFEDFSTTGTWKIDGKKFIVSNPGVSVDTAEILTLNATTFEYKANVNLVDDQPDLGYKITTTGTYIFKMTKK